MKTIIQIVNEIDRIIMTGNYRPEVVDKLQEASVTLRKAVAHARELNFLIAEDVDEPSKKAKALLEKFFIE